MASRGKISDSQVRTMFNSVEGEVSSLHSDRFRRVWVSYTRIGKERVDVMYTLFPHDGEYRMVFFRGLTLENVTIESLIGLLG